MNIDLKTIGEDAAKKLEEILKKEGATFVKNNTNDAIELGEDVVRAVFLKEYDDLVPIVPPLSENPTMDELATREELLRARESVFFLVSNAEWRNQQRINELRKKAQATAMNVAGQVLGVLGGIAVKSLMAI